jgi:hypothetical protein
MQCDHHSNSDGTCNLAWVKEDENGDIVEWDMSYGISDEGHCVVDDDEFPGDQCECYQPDLAGEYCQRCGEYLGDDPDDENDETKECFCDD